MGLKGLAVAAALVALALAAALGYRGSALQAQASLRAAEARLATVLEVNAAQQAVLVRVTTMRAADDSLQAELRKTVDDLTVAAAKTSEALRELEKTNADVKAYLSSPVPDDLLRLLNSRRGDKAGPRQ